MSGFWKVCSFLCTQYLVGHLFAWITASMRSGHGGNQHVGLLRCNGSPGCFDSGLQVICIVGSGVSHLPLEPRYSMGFRSGEFAGQSSAVTPWSLDQLLVPLAVWASHAGKWNQHLHKACQQMEAWSALKCPGRWVDCGLQKTQWTNTSRWHDSPNHWATVQLFFSLAQVRCFWRCFCFRSGFVALFLKMSDHGDSWCTDSSFSSLLVKLSQVFELALLDSILKLVVIPVACAHFPTQCLPSSQLCI